MSAIVVTRLVIRLAFPFAVRRMHAHLANPRFENEPIVIEILGHATCNQVTNYQPKGY